MAHAPNRKSREEATKVAARPVGAQNQSRDMASCLSEKSTFPQEAAFLDIAGPAHVPALLLHAQQTVGNQAVQRLVQRRVDAQSVIQRWPWDRKSPERQAYEDAQSKLEDFRKKNYPAPDLERFIPSTGGKFRVQYFPRANRLQITVKCWFEFIEDGPLHVDEADMPKAAAERRAPRMIQEMWSNEAKQEWKRKFFTAVNADWSNNFDYYCHKDWWESLTAVAMINFYEVPDSEAGGADLRVRVHKGWGVRRSNVALGGAMELNDFDVDQAGGKTAVHEAGHVLGLGDEYADSEKPSTKGEATTHSGLVEAEFGHKVIRGQENPDSIMAGGVKILPEHGVTFLEAIRKVTNMQEWHMQPKPPKPEPQ